MKARLTAIAMISTLALAGCGEAPMPDPSLYKGSRSSDANGPQGLDSGNQNGTGQAPGNAASSADLRTEAECAKGGFYFDLATNECTNRRLVKVTCTVDNITNPAGSDFFVLNPGVTSDFLADNQKNQVKFLFTQGELRDFTLSYCVDDVQQYTLVAVKDVNGQKQVQEVDVPR